MRDLLEIEGYTQQGIIGEGGFGRIYLHTENNLSEGDEEYNGKSIGSSFIAKIPVLGYIEEHKDPVINEYIKKSFKNEAHLLRTLNGQHHFPQVATHHLGKDGKIPYIIMKYFKGKDLEHIIVSVKNDNEQLPFSFITNIAQIMYETTQKVHDEGYLHNDLKPQNWFYKKKDKDLALLDFGLALEIGEEKPAISMGTPTYSSPELQDPKKAKLTQASDAYSLAVILHELIDENRIREAPGVVNRMSLNQIPLKEQNTIHLKLKLKGKVGENYDIIGKLENIPKEYLGLKNIIEETIKPNPEDRMSMKKAISILNETANKQKHLSPIKKFIKMIFPEKYPHPDDEIKKTHEMICNKYTSFRIAPSSEALRIQREKEKYFIPDQTSFT